MKYDIAKNEDGPLRKTMKKEQDVKMNETSEPHHETGAAATARRYPALDERLRNIETHVAVRYGEFF